MDIVMNADALHDGPGVGVRGSSEYKEEVRAAHNSQRALRFKRLRLMDTRIKFVRMDPPKESFGPLGDVNYAAIKKEMPLCGHREAGSRYIKCF